MFHKQNLFITLRSDLMGEPLHKRDNNTDKALLQQEKSGVRSKVCLIRINQNYSAICESLSNN